MRARLLVAAGIATFSVGALPLTAIAAPPAAVVIHIVPNTIPPAVGGPCPPFTCGTWDLTSDSFADSGTYKPISGRVAPPDRFPFSPGPLFESFMLTSSRSDSTLTFKAEERLVGTFPNQSQIGVWQIQSGTGDYADASGHGDVSRSLSPITLILTGVIGKAG
jgi:hypothetical protein